MMRRHCALDNGLWMRIKNDLYLVETGIQPEIGRHIMVMDTDTMQAHVRPYCSDIPRWSVVGCVTSVAHSMIEGT